MKKRALFTMAMLFAMIGGFLTRRSLVMAAVVLAFSVITLFYAASAPAEV